MGVRLISDLCTVVVLVQLLDIVIEDVCLLLWKGLGNLEGWDNGGERFEVIGLEGSESVGSFSFLGFFSFESVEFLSYLHFRFN